MDQHSIDGNIKVMRWPVSKVADTAERQHLVWQLEQIRILSQPRAQPPFGAVSRITARPTAQREQYVDWEAQGLKASETRDLIGLARQLGGDSLVAADGSADSSV
jgi:hypothetical protein